MSHVIPLNSPVTDFMTINPVVSYPEASLFDAVKIMTDNAFRRLPIVSKGRLVGILTVMDVLRALSQVGLDALYRPIQSWMTEPPKQIQSYRTIGEAIEIMGSRDIGSLLVVDKNNNALRGILTERDILDHFRDFIKADWEIAQLPSRYYSMRLLTAARESNLEHVMNEMVSNGVRRIIAYDDIKSKILGILTATDILRYVRSHVEGGKPLDLSRVSIMSVATTKVVSLGIHIEINNALDLMVRKKIGAIPLLDDHELVGILTERAFLLLLQEQHPDFVETNA